MSRRKKDAAAQMELASAADDALHTYSRFRAEADLQVPALGFSINCLPRAGLASGLGFRLHGRTASSRSEDSYCPLAEVQTPVSSSRKWNLPEACLSEPCGLPPKARPFGLAVQSCDAMSLSLSLSLSLRCLVVTILARRHEGFAEAGTCGA